MQGLQGWWTDLVDGLGWVDMSALVVVSLFFLLGLCKGMVWQIGRAVAVLGGYGLAARLGPAVAEQVAGPGATYAHVYLAYAVVFVVAFVLLALAGRLVQSLVQRAGLGWFDRLGGGLLGVGTGAAVVLGMLAGVAMLAPRTEANAAVQQSHAMALGRATVAAFGGLVPAPVQAAFAPAPAADAPQRAATPALDQALRDAGQER